MKDIDETINESAHWEAGPLDTLCRVWNRTSITNEYGRVMRQGKLIRVARLLYERRYGPILEGLLVLHKCDNRACINPEHLFIGTHQDNIDDMLAKGRGGQTKNTNSAFLYKRQVKEIRALLGTQSQASIARKYHVSPALITLIKQGKVWPEC
jgi:HNH endonuclease